MVTRGLNAGVLLGVLLAAGTAGAQNNFFYGEPTEIFIGQQVELVAQVQNLINTTWDYDQLEFTLPSRYKLVDVLAGQTPPPTFAGTSLLTGNGLTDCANNTGPVYDGCPSFNPAVAPFNAYTAEVFEDTGGFQVVRVSIPAGLNIWNHLIGIRAEVVAFDDCATAVTCEFNSVGPGPTQTLTSWCAPGSVTVQALTGVVPDAGFPTEVFRRAAEPTLQWDWIPQGLPPSFTPLHADVVVTCQDPTQCTGPDNLIELLGSTSDPATQSLRVLNKLADPTVGDTDVVLDAEVGGTTFPAVATVRIRTAPLQDYIVARTTAPGQVELGADVDMVVTAATNQWSGLEPVPHLADWYLTYAADYTAPLGFGPVEDWWLTTTAEDTEAATFTLNANAGLDDLLQTLSDGDSMRFVIWAQLPDSPQSVPSPLAGVLFAHEVALGAGGFVDAGECRVHAIDTTLGFGDETGLEVRIHYGDGESERLTEGVAGWEITAGGGEIATGSDPATATYRAPLSAGEVTVTAEFASGLCDTSVPSIELTVASEVTITSVRTDRHSAQAGGMMTLLVTVESTSGESVDGLHFVIDHDPALEPIRSLPSSADGAISMRATASLKQGLNFSGDMAAGAEPHELRLPFYVRPAAGCRQAKMNVALFRRAADTTALGTGEAEVAISCDPELFEATLVGKVFDDRNGNGTQEQGEPGIPGAMVALSASIYALTDEHGRYHVPRLDPGRVAVKLNESTLPIGARASGLATRVVTLTPGMFTRVTFAVETVKLGSREALAFVSQGSGVALREGEVVYGALFASGVGGELTAHRGDQVLRATARGDLQLLELPLTDTPHWLLMEREPNGRSTIYLFGVHVYEQESGALVLPWGPRLLTRMVVPPDGQAPRTGTVSISAAVHGAGTTRFRTVNEDAKELGDCKADLADPNGEGKPLHCALPLSGDTRQLALRLDPDSDDKGDDPQALKMALPLSARDTEHFFVGLGGGRFGCDPADRSGTGAGAFTTAGGNLGCFGDGGGSFFYRGELGDFTLSAGLDANALGPLGSARNWANADAAFTYLMGHNRTRVFRDLDPESYYPTYGDGSVVVDEREADGRFFFRLQWKDDYLRWGGLNTGIGAGEDEVEAGRYVRSLYGLGGHLTLGDYGDSGGWGVRAVAFGAQPYSAAARDELTVTGGSLYFLSHRDVVEGSVRVTLEILDEISELPIRRVTLSNGVEYELDNIGGRLTLDPALSQRFFGGSLTSLGSGGPEARLIVEYEYNPLGNLTRDLTTGARVIGQVGPGQVGVTYVTELQGFDQSGGASQSYQLIGATARLELGELLGAKVDFAHSRGMSHTMGRSYDGGLDGGEPVDARRIDPDDVQGFAVSSEVTTEIIGIEGKAYGRYFDFGFSDSRHKPGQRLLQAGLVLAAEFETGTALQAQYDYRLTRFELADGTRGPATPRNTGLLSVTQKVWGFELGVEGRYIGNPDPDVDTHRLLLGAQVGYRFVPELLLAVRRRQRVLGDSPFGDSATGETALGASYHDDDNWSLGAEVGLDDEARFFGRVQGGIPVSEDTQIYVGYLRGSRLGTSLTSEGEEQKNRLVTGGRRRHASGVSLFAENAIEDRRGDQLATRTVGGELALSKKTAVTFNYQRGALTRDETGESGGRTVRDAASVGGVFSADEVRLQVSVDGRVDEGSHWQLGVQGRGEVQATEALALALGVRGASSFEIPSGRALKGAWEGSAGFALRPVESDFINLFGRYALVFERDLPDAPEAVQAASHIGSLAIVLELFQPLAVGSKVAYRYSEITMIGGTESPNIGDDALVAALRGDLHLNETWDATVEGRFCASPTSGDDPTGGALAEVSVLILGWMRLGAGYNFSDISTSGVVCREPGARGFFVRAEAMY